MLCPNCESENRAEARFCDQCGFPLTEVQTASTDQAPVDDGFSGDAIEEQECSAEDELPDAEPVDSDSGRICITDVPGDEPIETDYELYQPLDSDNTDTFDPGAAIDKLIFAGEEDLLQPTPRHEQDLTGFDRHSEEYTERLVNVQDMLTEQAYHDGGTIQMPRVEGDEAAKSHDYLASSTKKRKSRKKLFIGLAIAIVAVAALAVFATFQMGLWGGKIVPDVVGLTENDARSLLVDEGFEPRTEQIKSDDTEGLVLLMDPAAQSRAEEGAQVVIHVATSRTIPDVSGKTEDEAKQLLADEGYENVKVKKKNSDKKEGSVIGVSPKAGERAISSTEVTITIAQPYTVPDVSGKSFDDAVKALKDSSLGYDVLYISTDDYPEGTILGTDPAAGTKVDKGTYVMIQIAQSRGAQLEELVREQFAAGQTIDHAGGNFTIESLDSVAYQGNNTVAYTVTAREFGYLFGIMVSDEQTVQISGVVVFDNDNQIIAVS